MDDIFRVTKDASGNPIYTHNNESVSKDVFNQRKQASSDETKAMRNAVTPGIDDDPDMMAMREKVNAMAASKKSQKKAKGGIIKSSASSRADGCVTKGKTKGRFV
jgi:hypothetical protein